MIASKQKIHSTVYFSRDFCRYLRKQHNKFDVHMKKTIQLLALAVLIGCPDGNTAPETIPNVRKLVGGTTESRPLDSGAIPALRSTVTFEHQRRVDSVLFSPNSKMLASSAVEVKLTDARSGKLLDTLPLRGYAANSIGFPHDGSVLAIGTNRGDVELWDMETHKLKQKIQVTQWSIYAVALSSDGSVLASCAADGTVQIWNLNESKLKQTLGSKGERMTSLAFSRDGSLLAALSRYGRCCVWEAGTGNLVGEIPRAGDGELGQVSFPADGNTVVITTPLELTLWNPQLKGKPQRVSLPESISPWKKKFPIGGGSGPVLSPLNTLSRDGETVATGLEDGSIAVWTVKTRTIKCILVGDRTPGLIGGGLEAMAFSGDGQMLASGNRNGKVQIWRVMTDQQ